MSLITVSVLTREELLDTSARRWDALRLARPDLVPAVDLQQRLLTIVADTAHAIGRSRLPRLSLPPKYLAAKLARGVPVFAGEPIPIPLGLLRESLLKLCDALAEGGAADSAIHIRDAIASGSMEAGSLLTASLIAGIEMFLLPRASMRWLDALPFAAVFILKTLVYGAIAGAVLAGQPGERLLGVVRASNARTELIAVCLALVLVAVMVMMFQAAGLVGYRTFMALSLGRYRRPYAERRFFLFVDVVGSTAIAERLGALEAHRFLAAVFSTVAEPVELYRGEIYQYVGDEIVITWVEADGVADARALRCFFAMSAALAADASRFVQRFGVQPELRAALHLGEVIAGEIGQVRRAIVFHGDVMNTTGRLEQATREVGCFFIASAEALAPLAPPPGIRTRDLGALVLRGRTISSTHGCGTMRPANRARQNASTSAR